MTSGLTEHERESLRQPYCVPDIKDMLVTLCYFNPTQSKVIRSNHDLVVSRLGASSIPYVSISADTQSVMFRKENLWNIGATRHTQGYEKLCFIDADIVFGDPDWYTRCSRALDTFTLVQPFSEAILLDSHPSQVLRRAASAIADREYASSRYSYPGHAIAMRRSFFDHIGGFYDRFLIGGGDNVIMSALLGDSNVYLQHLEKAAASVDVPRLNKYIERVKTASPGISYIDVPIFHLYHGRLTKRMYRTRYTYLRSSMREEGLEGKILDDLLEVRNDGVLEWKPIYRSQMNKILMRYFVSRQDDM